MDNCTPVKNNRSSEPSALVVDARCLAEPFPSGVGEYACQLLSRLPAALVPRRLTYFHQAAHPVAPALRADLPVDWVKTPVPSKLWNFSVRALHAPRLDQVCQARVVWLPSLQSVALNPRTQLAVTVHDLSFERCPEFFSAKSRLWHRLVNPRWLCRRADVIFAVSEHTKSELTEVYGISADRIAVTPLGVGKEFSPERNFADERAVRERYRLPERYVLVTGNLEPRKNVGTAIAAFQQLSHDVDLVIVGRPVRGHRELLRQAHHGPRADRIHFHGYAASADRPALYRMARCLVYPSYYEGFGLPPLEAMACGTPVIAAHATSLPEVVKNAGLLVDPYDVNDVAAAITAVLTDETLTQRMRARGLEQAKKFSWQTTVDLTAKVLRALR